MRIPGGHSGFRSLGAGRSERLEPCPLAAVWAWLDQCPSLGSRQSPPPGAAVRQKEVVDEAVLHPVGSVSVPRALRWCLCFPVSTSYIEVYFFKLRWNSHNIQLTMLKVYNSVAFSKKKRLWINFWQITLRTTVLEPWDSESGQPTSSITRDLIRKAESQAPSPTYWIWKCILRRSPGDSYTH